MKAQTAHFSYCQIFTNNFDRKSKHLTHCAYHSIIVHASNYIIIKQSSESTPPKQQPYIIIKQSNESIPPKQPPYIIIKRSNESTHPKQQTCNIMLLTKYRPGQRGNLRIPVILLNMPLQPVDKCALVSKLLK